MTLKLACPKCENTESLGTIEQLRGYAGGVFSIQENGELAIRWYGETKVDWDSTKTVGYICVDCGIELLLVEGSRPNDPPMFFLPAAKGVQV